MSKVYMTAREWKRSAGAWIRATFIGAPFGCIPAGGTEIPTFLSYAVEKKLAKGEDKAEFGTTGAIEGVAGPEAANNADTAGALVPLLTLGIPGGGATAILLGAFIMYGIQPGPLLFQNRPDLVWGLIDSMYVGNLMLLILNLPLIGIFVRLLYIPASLLMPLILSIATRSSCTLRSCSGCWASSSGKWTFRSRRWCCPWCWAGSWSSRSARR
jgi:putative tricarboxylic transport membrane protein